MVSEPLRHRLERVADVGSYEWDVRTGAVTWSPHLYHVLGRDPAAGPLPIRDLPGMIRPADVVAGAKAASWLVERGRTLDLTCPVRVRGQIRHLRAIAEPVHDASGRLVGVRGVVRDVSVPAPDLPPTGRWLPPADAVDTAAADRMAARLRALVMPDDGAPADLAGLRVELGCAGAARAGGAAGAGVAGGDWSYAAVRDDGCVLLAIGDVAATGLPAVVTMANLRRWLVDAARRTGEPVLLLDTLNQALIAAGDGMTASALIAGWDPIRAELTWARAGHPAPVLRRRGTCRDLAGPAGSPLGSRRARYEPSTVTVDDGDALLLYTSGVLPGAACAGDRPARYAVRALRNLATDSRTPALPALLEALAPASGPGCALLARPRRTAPGDAPAGATLLISRDFDRDTLDGTRAEVLECGARQGLTDLPLYNLTLAVTEVVTNAVRHGGAGGHLWMWRTGDDLLAEVVDGGRGIPAARRSPRGPEPGRIGGWGLWLTRQICASVDIDSCSTGTRVRLRYPLTPPEAMIT
jgi:anti-sigma regulatory factor (Ser/Thr protein kinase)